jgi:hypothetical protein
MSTFQALFVALLAVLPGALYTLARENFGASWAWQQTDTATQIFRFLGASAVFHVLFAPLTYRAYQEFVVTDVADNAAKGETLSWWWWAALVGYVALPYALGALTESSRNWRLSTCWLIRWPQALLTWCLALFVGKSPEPRAWDWLFSTPNLGGYIRLRLANSEGWKAGLWLDSYASGFGVDPDLYIAEEVAITDDGEIITIDDNDSPGVLGRGLLIRWSEIKYLDFTKFDPEGGTDGKG